MSEVEKTFYVVKPNVDVNEESPFYEHILSQIDFEMDMNTVTHIRQVYTIWNLLGDIGGLYGILVIFGYYLTALVSFLTGTGLHLKLISRLYKFEAPKTMRNRQKVKHWLKQRPPAKFSWVSTCYCSSRRKEHALYKRATDTISAELDVITFLRKQLIDKVKTRLLFTPAQRFLMKHQLNTFILHSHKRDKSE